MPDATPIYAFPFPCPDEVITPLSFTELANAIDAKLLEVNADMVFALNRSNIDYTSDTGTQVIPAGVETVLTPTSSTYTITVPGVYAFWVRVASSVPPATITAQRVRVRLNGVVQYGFTHDSDANNPVIVRATGPIIATTPGDVISTTFIYTGTGTNTVSPILSAKLLCRIP
jgi:hypothetical protein